MSLNLIALCFDAHAPVSLGHFWASLLGWRIAPEPDVDCEVLPPDDTGFRLDFSQSDQPKVQPNQMHFDLTSQSQEQQDDTVARALGLGARHLDIGQGADATHVVMADPEGNEFCVIGPGNSFLADCGFVGALASDGSRDVGYFWSAALDWPLVWDQDEETAIRSPRGGPKVTWGGPPVASKRGKNRLHFDLAPPAGGDQGAEVQRLETLGARRIDIGQRDVSWVVMADPDGNEFCVLTPR